MSDIIYPRSPRETMDGWPHLPRYVDKIRLHIAGKLHADYQPNYGARGFDKSWLDAAGVTHPQMVEIVKKSITDGEVSDWVKKNVKKSALEKAAFLATMLNYPAADDADPLASNRSGHSRPGPGAGGCLGPCRCPSRWWRSALPPRC
jgi:hypothetical protein